MRIRLLPIVFAFALAAFPACSSSSSGGDDSSGGGAAGSGGSTPDSGTTDDAMSDAMDEMSTDAADGATTDAPATSLAAPHLDMVMKMNGALHVTWTNNQPDCDTVRVERKTDTDAWAEKYSVPGSVDNKMDGTATANTTYTYRVRCAKGGAFSDYSNEMSKNPTQ